VTAPARLLIGALGRSVMRPAFPVYLGARKFPRAELDPTSISIFSRPIR
jgi:hypothetical protein